MSNKKTKYDVNFFDFNIKFSIPTSSNNDNEARTAASDKIGGLLNCQPSAVLIGINLSGILNLLSQSAVTDIVLRFAQAIRDLGGEVNDARVMAALDASYKPAVAAE